MTLRPPLVAPGHPSALSRRTVVAGGIVAAARAAAATGLDPPWRTDLAFEIWRNGRDIAATRSASPPPPRASPPGSRRTSSCGSGRRRCSTNHHEATETWREGRFAGLRSRTTSNGKREAVSAVVGPGGVSITTAGGRTVSAAADAAPLTHWNRDALRRPLFNPQTGALIRVDVQQRPDDSALLSSGRTVPATRYTRAGDAQMVDWYDGSNVWTALRGKVQDGSYVEYRRIV